jgi:ABC-type polysaccharide/polyol phosphate transport system ATPase subunit
VERFCNRAIWLDGGRIAASGAPAEVIAKYREAILAREQAGTSSAGPLPRS